MKNFIFKGKSERAAFRLGWLVFAIVVVLDQASKYVVLRNAGLAAGPVTVIPGFFDLVHVRNTGAAWGLMSGNNMGLLIVSAAVFVLLLVFYRYVTEGWAERYQGLFLILAGIIGNSIDRFYRGSVVDFLDFHAGPRWHWPSFNVADSSICVGVAIIVVSSLIRPSGD